MLGNVFSPYYAQARARGGVVDPLAFCTMNVVLHGPKGSLSALGTRFALNERGRASLRREPQALEIGPSAMRWEGDTLVITLDEATAMFPVPVRGAIRGTVRVRPQREAAAPVALDPEGRHRWWPVATSARVEVSLSEPALRWCGNGYHDANTGDRPLEADFRGWCWSRATVNGDGVVLYDTELRDGARRVMGRRFTARGVEALDAPRWVELPKSAWGIARNTRCDAGASAAVEKTLLDAPFYTRSVLRTRLLGRETLSFHEAVDLGRFAKPWVQFLVPFKMRRV